MSLWRAIVMLLTLKCDHATHLISDNYQRNLTGVERWALRLHQLSCRYCRRFARQIQRLHEAARRLAANDVRLSTEARQRIATSLDAGMDAGRDSDA